MNIDEITQLDLPQDDLSQARRMLSLFDPPQVSFYSAPAATIEIEVPDAVVSTQYEEAETGIFDETLVLG